MSNLMLCLKRQSGEMIKSVQGHQKGMLVTDLQFSSDRTYFITASKDKTAKVLALISAAYCRSLMQILLTFSRHMYQIPLSTQPLSPQQKILYPSFIYNSNFRSSLAVVKKLVKSPQPKSVKGNSKLDSIIKFLKTRLAG